MTSIVQHCRLVLLSALVFSAGCLLNEKQEILAHYLNQEILSISPIETAAFKRYAAVTGENYTSISAISEALRLEVIPIYERFFVLVKAIQPEDPEVAKAHSFYVRGAGEVLDGFKMKLYGLSKNDVYLIQLGNTHINEGLEQTLRWKTEIEALLATHELGTSDREKSEMMKMLEDFSDSVSNTRI